MVKVIFSLMFERKLKKVNEDFKIRIRKYIAKIIDNPEIGKPMRYNRKGTREVYAGHFRLSYAYFQNEEKIIFLDVYHKDEQ